MSRFTLVLALVLAGCTRTEYRTVEVPVPVAQFRTPPAELAEPYRPETLPVFVFPADPSSAACLSDAGVRELRAMLRTLADRDAAWRAWAQTNEEQK